MFTPAATNFLPALHHLAPFSCFLCYHLEQLSNNPYMSCVKRLCCLKISKHNSKQYVGLTNFFSQKVKGFGASVILCNKRLRTLTHRSHGLGQESLSMPGVCVKSQRCVFKARGVCCWSPQRPALEIGAPCCDPL